MDGDFCSLKSRQEKLFRSFIDNSKSANSSASVCGTVRAHPFCIGIVNSKLNKKWAIPMNYPIELVLPVDSDASAAAAQLFTVMTSGRFGGCQATLEGSCDNEQALTKTFTIVILIFFY